MTAINWQRVARGRRVVPVALVHGMPVVLWPSGVEITGITATGTDVLWWPTGSDLEAYGRDWIDPREPITWTERATPTSTTQLDVGAVELHLLDPDGAATELLDAELAALGTSVTAEIAPTDFTVHVASTTGFGSSGVIYVGREAMRVGSKTSTTFTIAAGGRGEFGSVAQRHYYAAALGTGFGNPEVTATPPDATGRLVTLWFAELDAAGNITRVDLQFIGHAGLGDELDDRDRLTLHIDHAVQRLGQPIHAGALGVGGIVHAGNRGARTSMVRASGLTTTGLEVCLSELEDQVVDAGYVLVLTEDDAPPDSGGFHAVRQGFVDDLNRAAQGIVTGSDTLSFTLTDDGRLAFRGTFTNVHAITSWRWAFDDFGSGTGGSSTVLEHTSRRAFPEAWVPIVGASRVYLTADEWAAVPPVPTLPAGAADTHTEAYWCLAFGENRDVRYARITEKATAGSAFYLSVVPISPAPLNTQPGFEGWPDSYQGWVVTKPTTARLALNVRSDDWVSALRYALSAIDAEAADTLGQAVDWDDMARVATRFRGPFATAREYVLDVGQSVLDVLTNECALQGYALTTRRGRVTIQRVAEFAGTEQVAASLTSADVAAADPMPRVTRGADGICNTFTLSVPEIDTALTVVDRTSWSRYGQSRVAMKATLPPATVARPLLGGGLVTAVAALAAQSIGPHRYPYRHVSVTLTLAHHGLSLGDLVSIGELWRVPDGAGRRGLEGVVGQVVSRAPSLWGDESAGTVAYTFRVNPRTVTGWAPSLLVDAGGLDGTTGVVTADRTTFGSSCFAETTWDDGEPRDDGGVKDFVVGDKVRLLELDSTTPYTSQHTVVAVGSVTVTLDPPPDATMVALAASTLKVMLGYDDWDVVVSTQQRFGFWGASDGTIDGSVRASRYAS